MKENADTSGFYDRKGAMVFGGRTGLILDGDTLGWRPFLVSQDDGRLPPLLIAGEFAGREYKVYLTDLTNMWCESMDRKAIFKRALVKDTSIDPTEDDEQMRLLLNSVARGLDGDKDTDVTLAVWQGGPENERGVKGLKINIKAQLPKPLKPLEWTCELTPSPSNEMASKFVLPLINAQIERVNQIESLVDLIGEKDHVIQKLLDKLETSGTELGQVFPSAAGKGGRKIQRKTYEDRIKGLAAFDKEAWARDSGRAVAAHQTDELKTTMDHTAAFKHGLAIPRGVAEVPSRWRIWWEHVVDEVIPVTIPSAPETPEEAVEEQQGEEPPTEGDNAEEEVQVAETQQASQKKQSPAKARPDRSHHIVDDDETTEDEDLDSTSQSRSQVPDSFVAKEQPAKQSPRKLGIVGGKKGASKAKSPTPQPEPEPEPEAQAPSQSTRSHTVVDDDTTEDEDEGEDQEPSPKQAKKGRLGDLGGRKRTATPSPEPEPEVEQPKAKESPKVRRKPKLGEIGRENSDLTEGARGRSSEKEDEIPRETSQERRARLRAERDKMLEKQAKAPPKKKRKF